MALRNLADSRIPGKRLLEIGCSYGFFLAHARKQGWDVTGIELNRAAAAVGRNELSLDIHTGTLENTRLSPPYDVITAFHVIEHLVDPLRFLTQCESLLRDDGILMLKTPNVGSWVAKKAGEYWAWHCPPAHIHLFTPEAMHLAATKSGFRMERIWTQRGDSGNNLFERISAWGRRWYRRTNRTQNRGQTNLSSRRPVKFVRSLTDIVYFPVGLILDPWLAKGNLQPEIVLIARKTRL
jgi:SAM-dependent methyltransferase